MNTEQPVRVGLVGAGPWAHFVHAPMLAAGPETVLAGVWARRADAARELADAHGAPAYASFEALLRDVEAVACCVAPDAQVEFGIAAAEAGKALLLEKPLGLDLVGAQRLVDAIEANDVISVVVLTNRFAAPVREFLTAATEFEAHGARGIFVSGALAEGPFATSGWRKRHGAWLDVGPHILDLVDAALGPIVALDAHHDANGQLAHAVARHENGAVSVSTVDCTTPGDSRTEVELFGPTGRLTLDARTRDPDATFATLRAEFAHAVRTRTPHPIDARRALAVQRWLY